MKVFVDRNYCNVEGAGCESCFAGRIEENFTNPVFRDMDLAGCVLRVEEEVNRDEIIFFIHDRDGEDKILQVTQENWPDAYNSWMELYEIQRKSRSLMKP